MFGVQFKSNVHTQKKTAPKHKASSTIMWVFLVYVSLYFLCLNRVAFVFSFNLNFDCKEKMMKCSSVFRLNDNNWHNRRRMKIITNPKTETFAKENDVPSNENRGCCAMLLNTIVHFVFDIFILKKKELKLLFSIIGWMVPRNLQRKVNKRESAQKWELKWIYSFGDNALLNGMACCRSFDWHVCRMSISDEIPLPSILCRCNNNAKQ